MDCHLCESTAVRPSHRNQVLPVHRCQDCGAVFLSPQPDADSIRLIYDDHYHEHWDDAVGDMKCQTFGAYLDVLPSGHVAGRLLDVGCATGFFLELAETLGWSASGVELSHAAADKARQRFGDRVVHGTLESAQFDDNSFDLVTLFDVIEHIPSPVPFVTEITRVLKPGGRALIVTPDISSFSARVMGRTWLHYKPEHLFYYSADTLSRLLQAAGLETQLVKASGKCLSFDYLVHHFLRFHHWALTPLARLGNTITPDWLLQKTLRFRFGEMLMLAGKPNA